MSEGPFITTVEVRASDGPHEYVSVWIRGQQVGTLCVGKGDGEPLRALLMPSVAAFEEEPTVSAARPCAQELCAHARSIIGIDLGAEPGQVGMAVFDPAANHGMGQFTEVLNPSVIVKHNDWREDLTPWMRGSLDAMHPEEDFAGRVPGFRNSFEPWPERAAVAVTEIPIGPERLPSEEVLAKARSVTRRLHATMDAERMQRTGYICPRDLKPDERTMEIGIALGMTEVQVLHVTETFVSYWMTRADRRDDWQRKLRTWLKQAAESPAVKR